MPLPVNPEAEVRRLLRGATLVRTKKHNVYELPNGKRVSMANTPSDVNAVRQQLRSLEKALGLREGLGEPGERRERPSKQGRREAPRVTASGARGSRTLAESLGRVYGKT